MADLSRRGFLAGLLASAAIVPLVRVTAAPAPMYAGEIGEYMGVRFVRAAGELTEGSEFTVQLLKKAKELALTCGRAPTLNGYYFVACSPRQAQDVGSAFPCVRIYHQELIHG